MICEPLSEFSASIKMDKIYIERDVAGNIIRSDYHHIIRLLKGTEIHEEQRN